MAAAPALAVRACVLRVMGNLLERQSVCNPLAAAAGTGGAIGTRGLAEARRPAGLLDDAGKPAEGRCQQLISGPGALQVSAALEGRNLLRRDLRQAPVGQRVHLAILISPTSCASNYVEYSEVTNDYILSEA